MKRALLPLALGLLSSCVYFNALYNAQRLFGQAERNAERGQVQEAGRLYGESIEKAAGGLRRDPDGRWADDALLLIGRAHFARGEYREARAALAGVRSDDRSVAGTALAYLGASHVRLGAHAAAITALDSALVIGGSFGEIAAFIHLWRARARFAIGDDARAWADLDAAIRYGGVMEREARIDEIVAGLAGRDSARVMAGFASLLDAEDARFQADTLSALASRSADTWSPGFAAAALRPVVRAPWPADVRGRVRLRGAELTLAAADTAAAEAELESIAGSIAGATMEAARLLLARVRLARASEPADVADVRTVLLPALNSLEARRLLLRVRALAVLLDRAQETGQPLTLFAAAELARDELGARVVAFRLFHAFVDLAPTSTWSAKALLAAIPLAPSDSAAHTTRALLAGYDGSVYYLAARGGDVAAAYLDAEQRLARILADLRTGALRDAERGDVSVGRAVVVLDSLKAVARADSLRIPCGLVVDSLALVGIRADSVRAACLRADAARVDSLLVADTLLLLPDSLRLRAPVTGDSALNE